MKQWIFQFQPEHKVRELTNALSISDVLARLLINRGIDNLESGDAFLNPKTASMHDPMLLHDMGKAVSRIRQAHAAKEEIRIFGDYDADGTCGAALLAHAFRDLGIHHSVRLPSRGKGGYGLSVAAVQEAAKDGVNVIITVDNGIAANSAVDEANRHGIDVIVTDHHKYGDELPKAYALVHPSIPGSEYPFKHLCGCALAFKLALALTEDFGVKPFEESGFRDFLALSFALSAIASVCDMVPLVGENRVIASLGLKALQRSSHPGVRALLEVANVTGVPTSTDIGFKIGPRINAAGRMEREEVALKLLMSREYAEALDHAAELDKLNRERQATERKMVKDAKELCKELPDLDDQRVVVVAGEGWSSGVVGLVASRLVDAYRKPAIAISCNGDELATGSGRSTPDFHLYNALADCVDLLERFGGHTFAAGVTLKQNNIDEFRTLINEVAEKHSIFRPGAPSLDIDAAVTASELHLGLAQDIQRMEPFGEGNREPLLAIEGARVIGRPKLVGKSSNHLSFQVVPPNGSGLRAIGFKLADQLEVLSNPRGINVAFRPIVSTWTGEPQLQLEVKYLDAC